MVDKVQSPLLDMSLAPVKGAISNSDYVFVRGTNDNVEKVLVSDLLAGTAGAIRIKGEADMDNVGTTLTSIVITGDPNNASISQDVAPVDASPNGVAYVVNTSQSGVQTQIDGTTKTVFAGDQISWTGSKWSILALGNAVTSVDGQTGDVNLEGKYYWDNNKPTASSLGVLSASASNIDWDLHTSGLNSATNQGPSSPTLFIGMTFPHNNNTAYNMQLASRKGRVFFRNKENNVFMPWNEFYHTSKKPTPADVGAVSATPLLHAGPDSLIVSGESSITTLGSSYTGLEGQRSLLTMPNGAGGFQIAARSIGSEIHVRAANSGTGEIGPWYRIYTTGFKPTAADVGALPSSYIPDWSVITNKPSFATRWPTYSEVTGKPTYFDTQWSQIDNVPASFPSTWNTVSGKPTQFASSWSLVAGKPSTFPPSTHNHDTLYYTKAQIDAAGYLTEEVADTEYASISHNHDDRYYTKAQGDAKYLPVTYTPTWASIQGTPSTFPSNWSSVSGKPSTFAPSAHNHDSLYYTKTYVDATFVEKDTADASYAPLVHNHDDRYYTKVQSDNKYKLGTYVPAWSEITSKPSTATRWPTFTEVTSKPATATRWPTWSEVTGKPTTFVADWDDITSIPVYAKRWPTKAEVGLSNVPNYTITNAVNDPSTSKFASAAAVNTLNTRVSSLESADGTALMVGSMMEFPPLPVGKVPHAGYIPMDGSLISRTDYQALWLWANDMGIVVSEAEWQAIKASSHGGAVSVYSSGSDGSTFRVPDIGTFGMVQRPMGSTRPNDDSRVKGHADQNKEHTHTITIASGGNHRHAISISKSGTGTFRTNTVAATFFDASSKATTAIQNGGVHTHTATATSEGGSETTMKYMWCTKWIYSGKKA